MTTIAWDGKCLAADSGSSIGDIRVLHEKVSRITITRSVPGYPRLRGDAFVSGSGDAGCVRSLVRWLAGEGDSQPEGDYHGLVVTRLGAHTTDSIGCWDFHGRKPIAVGLGAGMAMGAMLRGASAREAVLLVCEHGSALSAVKPVRTYRCDWLS